MDPIRVGLIGSSGGGAATLGHGDIESFIRVVRTELEVGSGGRFELSFVQMVACEQALDVADLQANATLWVSEKAGETPEIVASGTLKSQIFAWSFPWQSKVEGTKETYAC